MRNKLRAKNDSTVRRLVQNARFEVLPTPTIEDKVLAHVPRDVTVTVTASPSKGLEETLALTERLAAAGYDAVPHVAARMVAGRAQLEEIVGRLTAAGVGTVFVPGGDATPDSGYPDALSLLEDLTALGSPFPRVGIAGYPEPHPTIHDDITIQSVWDKRRHATHIVSNLTFDPSAVQTWVRRMRARGLQLPLLLGIPGPVEVTKLLTMATRIGVGDSTRFLAKQSGVMTRLVTPGGFTGQRFLEQCAPALGEEEARVEGLHVYTFNQVAETAAWRAETLDRLR